MYYILKIKLFVIKIYAPPKKKIGVGANIFMVIAMLLLRHLKTENIHFVEDGQNPNNNPSKVPKRRQVGKVW